MGAVVDVVADLAALSDRIAIATQEIRTMIDAVRDCLDATVTAADAGFRAVQAGTAQFTAAADSFDDIVDLVRTTTVAARTIERSTGRQIGAVEDINQAVSNTLTFAQAAETHSGTTFATAQHLAEVIAQLTRSAYPSLTCHGSE